MELNFDSKIVVHASIIPVAALREIEIKIPIYKIRCWGDIYYKKSQYSFSNRAKYRIKNDCYRSEIDEKEEN